MYIVIEIVDPANAYIITDKNGNNKVFDTITEAEWEADNCHKGFIIKCDN